MSKVLDLVDHLAWALPGIKVYLKQFQKTRDLRHGQHALEYARCLDKQWQDLIRQLEASVGASEPAPTPRAAAQHREETSQSSEIAPRSFIPAE